MDIINTEFFKPANLLIIAVIAVVANYFFAKFDTK